MPKPIVLLGFALIALAIQPSVPAQPVAGDAAAKPPMLTVTGRGEVEAEPDSVVVSLGATAAGTKADEVQSEINEAMQDALAKFKQLGIAEKDIKTQRAALTPVYDSASYSSDSVPRITGYRGSNIVSVQTSDFALVSKIIDAGIAAGVNQVQSISFQLKNDTEARKAALQQAVAQAREKAGAIADALGIKLGEIEAIDETGVNIVRPVQAFAGGGGRGGRAGGGAAPSVATQIQAGEINVNASISISYRIIPAAK
jgi:uncharacterized protein YggE